MNNENVTGQVCYVMGKKCEDYTKLPIGTTLPGKFMAKMWHAEEMEITTEKIYT